MHRLPFLRKSRRNSNLALEEIHPDACGPGHVTSMGGSKYFLTFIDDYSRFVAVEFLKSKSEGLDKFKEFVAAVLKIEQKREKRLLDPRMVVSTSGFTHHRNHMEKKCNRSSALEKSWRGLHPAVD